MQCADLRFQLLDAELVRLVFRQALDLLLQRCNPGEQRLEQVEVASTYLANQSFILDFTLAVRTLHYLPTERVTVLFVSRPAASLTVTRKVCSPGGTSAWGSSMPDAVIPFCSRGVRSTNGDFK